MAYSYTTAQLVQSELRATDAFASTTVPSLSTVTTWIEQESENINHLASGAIFGTSQINEVLDYNGEDSIYVTTSPVISVDTLLYNTTQVWDDNYSSSWEEKTENSDFIVKDNRGRIDILFPQFKPKEGKNKFDITYTAGYETTPKTIETLATKMVALRVLNSLVHNNVNNEDLGGSVSVGSISIVEPADFGVKSYEALKSEVDEMKKGLVSGFGVFRFGEY